MGMLSFLGIGSAELSPKQIEKIAKLASNPFAQPDVRKEQLQRLFRDGSQESIRAALGRFAINASQAIADEEEKRTLVTDLVALGQPAVEPLKDYLRKETALTFAAQALVQILPHEQAVGELLAVLDVYPPDDHRSDEQKRQIILLLSGENDARILPTLAPYLLDHSDDVRHHVIELFAAEARKKNGQASSEEVRTYFSALLRDADTSPRIIRQAAEIVAELEWQLPGTTDGTKLSSFVGEEFFIDKKSFLRRRAKPAARS